MQLVALLGDCKGVYQEEFTFAPQSPLWKQSLRSCVGVSALLPSASCPASQNFNRSRNILSKIAHEVRATP